MELYGFHRSVELSECGAAHFSAKVVVDKANPKKNDRLHQYACYVSAKFCLKVIERFS
jgi:hypothetical protein